jgi:hypothetical protein
MDITTIAQDVRALMAAEGMELSGDVGMAEPQVRQRMLAIGQTMLAQHFGGRKLGYEGSSRVCVCGASQKFMGYRDKHVVTLVGAVRLARAYYYCPACGASCIPYDQQVGLSSGAASPGVARAACRAGIEVPFAQAADLLAELAGVRLSERTVARLTTRAGATADRQEQAQAQRIQEWRDAPEAPVAGRLYHSADGTMIHTLTQWQEVKTQVVYWKDAQGNHQARYCSRLERIEEFVGHAWALSTRWGLNHCRQSVLIGDGAAWIWDRLGPVFDEAVQIVDWYHATEHLWTCGRAVYGEATAACTQWVETKKTLLWHGRWRFLIDQLQRERARRRGHAPRAALQSLITYLENQGSRLDYQKFRDQGLDVGSGTVESACRHVVQSRLKRAGTRWSTRGAQAVLSLRTCHLNGQWDTFWTTRPLAA